MSEENNQSDSYLSNFLKIAVALVLISIVFPFAVNYFFKDWTESGTFGDTFGALNAIFSGLAFAGIIITILIQRSELQNQRLELQLQRTEMKETRKEFLLNRTTTLVYNQLDRFEKCLSEFNFTHNGVTYIGNDAISFLDDKKETVYKPFENTEEDYKREMRESIVNLLKLYTPNKTQIEKLAHNAYNSVAVLKSLIYKTDLEIAQLNDLKNIFFVNIGFINMGVIERISDVAENELKYLIDSDYADNNLDVGRLSRANIFLKSIKKFYHQRLTEETFSEYKAEWLDSSGNQA